ncbi:zinc ribbon domain-containing protein [Dialister invisus]|uniref:zinc ribbon domain-containing protein n=1 Tax=Dialister invisus TaxID=218538 RepID=UPI003522CAA1
MTENQCPQCGAPIDPGAIECKFCGEKLAVQQARQQVQQSQPQPPNSICSNATVTAAGICE